MSESSMNRIPDNDSRKIFDDGFLAHDAGLSQASNPFSIGTKAHTFWALGWAKAAELAQEANQ